jgi:hypothetical protein
MVMRYGGRTTPDYAYWLSHPYYNYTVKLINGTYIFFNSLERNHLV